MHPILFDFGTWNLPLLGETHLFIASYGLLFALATLGAWLWFRRLAVRSGIPAADAETIGFVALVAGLLGSKLTLILLDLSWYLEDPARILGTLRAAGVLMGGVAAGLLAGIVACRMRRVPVWKTADAVAVPLPFAQAVGRLGCFLAGCCYGLSAPGLPWAVTFTDPDSARFGGTPLGEPLHPVQLYQFGADLVVGILVWLVARRKRFDGQAMLAFLILYPLDRILVEHWRGDEVRGVFFGGALSTSQIFSLVSLAAGLALWPVLSRPLRKETAR
jgi:phosphatidylglycerol:prolipoprotein diacylglycerol transferase